jgi:hypothetical protein
MLVNQGVAEKIALGEGLQWAILFTVLINVWAATHYMLAARTLNRDIGEAASARTPR